MLTCSIVGSNISLLLLVIPVFLSVHGIMQVFVTDFAATIPVGIFIFDIQPFFYHRLKVSGFKVARHHKTHRGYHGYLD